MTTTPLQMVPTRPDSRQAKASAPLQKIGCEFLSVAEYPDWDELVKISPHGTIFHHSWWLAITAPSFRILGIRNEQGSLVGGLPLPFKSFGGLRLLHAPVLAPYLGPIFDLSAEDGTCAQLHLMRSQGEILARRIGSFDSFRYVAGADAPDLQAFLWAGFSVSLAYTFRFSRRQSMDEITNGITRTHMQKIAKGKRLNLQVERVTEVEELLELNKMTFDRKGTVAPFSAELVRRLSQEAHSHGQANLYLAKTDKSQTVAALFTVHDERTTYQIISGFNPAFPDVPGQNCVLWTAIQDAIEAGRNYDFEGSGLRGVETFYRRWGCQAVPVWRIEKAGSIRGVLAHLAIKLKDRDRSKTSSH